MCARVRVSGGGLAAPNGGARLPLSRICATAGRRRQRVPSQGRPWGAVSPWRCRAGPTIACCQTTGGAEAVTAPRRHGATAHLNSGTTTSDTSPCDRGRAGGVGVGVGRLHATGPVRMARREGRAHRIAIRRLLPLCTARRRVETSGARCAGAGARCTSRMITSPDTPLSDCGGGGGERVRFLVLVCKTGLGP